MRWNRQAAVQEVLKRAEKDFRGVSIVLDATAGSSCADPSDPEFVSGLWRASAQGLRRRSPLCAEGSERADLEGLARVMEMYAAELEIVAGVGEASADALPPETASIKVDLVFDWPRWGTHRRY